MPIKPLFIAMDLMRAREILSSWTSVRRFSSDEADIITRMIAQGIAEGRRKGLALAEAEWPIDDKNSLEESKEGPGAKW